MSNSSLVTYKNITKNKTSPRNHAIDTITIHCIVGQWTAKQGCDYFATTDRQCSSNYIVGKDGSIGLSVEEKDRSWCSSNGANDHRAITIEVASDTSHPYAVTDAAYKALVYLCADICKRNGIKKLLWKADKNLIGQVDKQNMTVHRWFANKSCPGEYLYERHAQIAAEVNAKLGVADIPAVENDAPAVTGSPSTGSKSDEKVIWDFLMGKIGNAFGVAGLMGNLYAESALRSNNLQGSYERKLGYTDESYTAAVDSGKYDNFIKDSAGYGLAQWTYWTRKRDFLSYAQKQQKSIGDLMTQLGFLYEELSTGYKTVLSALKNATSVQEASDIVLTKFERPADMGSSVKQKRAKYGQGYYDTYASTKPVEQPVLAFSVGDTVQFTGLKHYTSSNANNAKSCKPGKAKVTAIAKNGKHQYHLVRVSGGGSTVYGWVDAAYVSDSAAAIKKGSKVKVRRGAKTYTGGNLAAFVYLNVYDVTEISGNRVVISKGKTVIAAVKAEDLIVQQ